MTVIYPQSCDSIKAYLDMDILKCAVCQKALDERSNKVTTKAAAKYEGMGLLCEIGSRACNACQRKLYPPSITNLKTVKLHHKRDVAVMECSICKITVRGKARIAKIDTDEKALKFTENLGIEIGVGDCICDRCRLKQYIKKKV